MDQVLKTRTISGVIFGVIVLGLLSLGEPGLFILSSIVLLGSLQEYLRITGASTIQTAASFILVVSSLIGVYTLNLSQELKLTLLFIALCFYILLSSSIFFTQKIPHKKLMPFITLIYPSASLLLPFVFKGLTLHQEKFWIYIIILIWSSDSFAYLVGRKIGKTKLFERLSPKKTWEGFLGAGLLTMAFAFVIGKVFGQLPVTFWLLTGFTIWVVGTIGDLFESSIKRMYDVKDSGNILPGHGGFLDRFDSFIFIVPFVYFLLYLFNSII